MKISSASKKVLASALSAAMVVAFAPTVAFGAQNTNKITVKYDLGAGIDANAGTQGALDLTQEYTVGGEKTVTFAATSDSSINNSKTYYVAATSTTAGAVKDTTSGSYYVAVASPDVANIATYFERTDGYTTDGAITLANPAGVKIASNDNVDGTEDDYALVSWDVSYDADGDGTAEWTSSANKGTALSVASEKVPAGATLTAKAVYSAATITGASAAVKQYDATAKGAVVTLTAGKDSGTVRGTAKFVVTSPDGTKAEKAALSGVDFAAQVGTYTIDLVDGNGVTLDTEKFYVGALVLTGGVFQSYADSSIDVAQQTVYYVADGTEKSYGDILGNTSIVAAANKTAYKVNADGTKSSTTQSAFYDAKGKSDSDVKTIGKNEKGAVTTELTAFYAGEVKFASFTAKNGTLTAVTAGVSTWISNDATGQAAVKDPAKKGVDGYYMVITDAAGKIVAETVDSDAADPTNDVASGSTITATVDTAGTYTATLYKMTAKQDVAAGAGSEAGTIAGKTEAVATLSVEVSELYAAAPSWSYEAKYKADGTVDGGILTLANTAGDGYDVLLSGVKYDTAKGGQAYTSLPTTLVTLQAKAKDAKADVQASKTVTLVSYNYAYAGGTSALANVTGLETTLKTKKVANAAVKYYGSNDAVKAAVAAAKKSITDAGFMAQNTTHTEWDAAVSSAKQSILEAVAGVAKTEAAAMYAGTAAANGDLTKLTEESYNKVLIAIDQVIADFAVNHDGDKTNNSKTTYANDAAYVNAIDAALTGAAKTTFKKADVDAAAAVTAALTGAKTGTEAEKALADYAALTATQKQLVATADVTAAEAVVAKAAEEKAAQELVDAQDEGTLNKISGTKTKTYTLKNKKKTGSAHSISYTTVLSKSGNVVTYAKASGSSKITVAESGKVTLKKGAVKGKTYTAKVLAACGTQTRTVTVKFKIK